MKHDAHVIEYRRHLMVKAVLLAMAQAARHWHPFREPPRWTWRNRVAWVILKLLGER